MPMPEPFRCGLPVCYEVKLYLATRINQLAEGQVLEFISPDPNAAHELDDWAALRGYEIIDTQPLDNQQTRFLIRR